RSCAAAAAKASSSGAVDGLSMSGATFWAKAKDRSTGPRALAEQHALHFRILHIDALAQFEAERHAALHRRPRLDRLQPALHMREVVDVLVLPFPEIDPADAGHVGDRIFAGEKGTVLEPCFHHAIEPVDLVLVALDGIWQRLARIVLEVVELAGHRAEPAHLPEQPLVDLDAAALIGRIELAGLAAEILQDGAGLEDRNRSSARSVRIDDRRHAVVRRDPE